MLGAGKFRSQNDGGKVAASVRRSGWRTHENVSVAVGFDPMRQSGKGRVVLELFRRRQLNGQRHILSVPNRKHRCNNCSNPPNHVSHFPSSGGISKLCAGIAIVALAFIKPPAVMSTSM